MSKEAIILAGGFGTRLGELTRNTPKPLVPVNGRPFLDILLNHLIHLGFERVVLSVGHLANQIQLRYGEAYKGLKITYAVETEPLGTGGAIRLALNYIHGPDAFVLNGDSYLEFDKLQVELVHESTNADITLVLRAVKDAARYGSILRNEAARITAFQEKSNEHKEGLINGGIYLINKKCYFENTPQGSFSIEKDVFQQQCQTLNIYSHVTTGFFIDIGIPSDYQRAQNVFKGFSY
jgi:D-glycero-alpha-D-manno-heptose 1-phosphate guanylyltransferase